MMTNAAPASAALMRPALRSETRTHYARILASYDVEQLAAVKQMYFLARQRLGTSGGNTAAKMLLGLYNGTRFPFDLTELRAFDDLNLCDALAVLRMDAGFTYCEIHTLIDAMFCDTYSTGVEFEYWACKLKLRGRCKKDALASAARIRP